MAEEIVADWLTYLTYMIDFKDNAARLFPRAGQMAVVVIILGGW